MYLRSLKVVGFKSFADRTHLELRPGVTVMVGPNGSGKSNLVDALSWVMGTQSSRALRSGKMEDVIFAGTATRPQHNRAEATLVIDNSDRLLPLDLDEVSITRRLYRDGSSDYELNGVECRLLDIQDLLSDSGVGRHQHVIIGQGQIDDVLSASPEEHRAVVEEAAGILKHRRRKERAERRLARTAEDLLRLEDVMGELTRQMRPLRRQARAAEAYTALRADVRALQVYLGGSAIAEFDRRLAEATARSESLGDAVTRDGEAMRAFGESIEVMSERSAAIAAELDRSSGAAARLETILERIRRIASIAHERSRALAGRNVEAEERRSDLEEERAALRSELACLEIEEPELTFEAERHEAQFRQIEGEEIALAIQVALNPEGAAAAVRGELSALEAAEAHDTRELQALGRRLEIVSGQMGDENDEIERINLEVRELDGDLGPLGAAYEAAQRRRAADQAAWESAEADLHRAGTRIAACEARLEALQAAASQGSHSETANLFERSEGSRGWLMARLDVPPALEPAVKAALGPWVDGYVFATTDTLIAAVSAAKSAGLGGLAAIHASDPGPLPARLHASLPGVVPLIDRLGEYADLALAGRLLGDTLLADDWVQAWEAVSREPALRAVTPAGDLVSVHGVRPASDASVLVEEATSVLEKARTELARATSRHTAARRDFETSRQREREALESLEAVESRLAGATEAMTRLRKSVHFLEEEWQRLTERKSSLEHTGESRSQRMTELRQRLDSLVGEEAERVRVWEELEARRAGLAAQREAARSSWQESAARLQTVVAKRKLVEDRLGRVSDEVARLGTATAPGATLETLRVVEDVARRSLEVLERRLVELRDRQAVLRDRQADIVQRLEQERSEYEAARRRVDEAKEGLASLQVELTELRLGREREVEALHREADCEETEAVAAVRPDCPEDTDLAELLESKLAELRRMGPVNPLAADEYAELEKRHTFLSTQIQDVETSALELRKVIRALEDEIQRRFDDAYGEVAAAYQRYFGLLFPGGKGRICMTDPDHPKESGLVLEAQPLGKKVGQLSLLSGGERSLAALAFLFAVFEARPSPFYVLDEVEAALDDTNLRRFLRIVDAFRERAQLIIVTHQQQTMEAADVLYGVTMEPGGSSKVVRKDMTTVAMDHSLAS